MLQLWILRLVAAGTLLSRGAVYGNPRTRTSSTDDIKFSTTDLPAQQKHDDAQQLKRVHEFPEVKSSLEANSSLDPTPSDRNMDMQSLKYQVEVFEPFENNIDNEMRFRDSRVSNDFDEFSDDMIEQHRHQQPHQDHVVVVVLLVITAMVIVALYATLVIWKAHLQQRYAMSELLADEDQYYSDPPPYSSVKSSVRAFNAAEH